MIRTSVGQATDSRNPTRRASVSILYPVSYLLLSHHTVVWLGHLVYCVFGCLSFCNFLFVRLRISQRRRMGREIFASVLAYYPDRSSPVLVNVSSREVTGAAALRRE